MSAYNFVLSGPKFNTGVIVLLKTVYSLSISSSISKTYALKLKSFSKLR